MPSSGIPAAFLCFLISIPSSRCPAYGDYPAILEQMNQHCTCSCSEFWDPETKACKHVNQIQLPVGFEADDNVVSFNSNQSFLPTNTFAQQYETRNNIAGANGTILEVYAPVKKPTYAYSKLVVWLLLVFLIGIVTFFIIHHILSPSEVQKKAEEGGKANYTYKKLSCRPMKEP